jgi:tetratricopeptide (TPR) repeat protein
MTASGTSAGRALRVVQRGGAVWEVKDRPLDSRRPPGEAQRLYEEARACILGHREVEAFEILQEVLWLDPQHVEALSAFGLCLAKVHGDLAQALDICGQALRLAPTNTEIRTNLGRVHRLRGDNAAAHKVFLAAYRSNPVNVAPAAELTRMGVRRPAILPFLPREHWCNRWLGRLRHRIMQFLGARRGRHLDGRSI